MAEYATRESVASIILLIMGVGMATLVLIFVGVLGGNVYQQTQGSVASLSSVIVNETSVAITDVPVTFSAASGNIWPASETFTIYYSTNGTQLGTLVRGTNYTVTSYHLGTFSITDIANKNSTSTVINATYTIGNPDIENNIVSSIRSSFTALNTTGSYLPIVVLAVIIFLVLGLVMSLTPGFRRESSAGYAL
jgi:hypothetical protein